MEETGCGQHAIFADKTALVVDLKVAGVVDRGGKFNTDVTTEVAIYDREPAEKQVVATSPLDTLLILAVQGGDRVTEITGCLAQWQYLLQAGRKLQEPRRGFPRQSGDFPGHGDWRGRDILWSARRR